jgi:hypothetical protein
MSDEIENSLHDKLVLAFIEYAAANEKFEIYGFSSSAVDARIALNRMYELIKLRRKEIQKRRIEMHGDKSKGIEPTAPSIRRQRKLDRQRQKEEAKKASGTN